MTERQIYAAVQEIAGRHVPDNIKITPFDTLVDLGMDSLDLLEIALEAEKEFGVTLDTATGGDITLGSTLAGITLLIKSKLTQKPPQ